MDNTLSAAELKRRGVAAIEEGLQRGPLRIVKLNKSAAVVLSESDYRRLTGERPDVAPGMTAMQWLLSQSAEGGRDKKELDVRLADERNW